MNKQYFKSSLDTLARNLTIALTILFAGMVVFYIVHMNDAGKTASLFVIGLLFVIFLSSCLFCPKGYIVTTDTLIIKRIVSPVTIVRSKILSAEQLDDNSLSGSIRLFGVGGLFGYFGKFSNRKLGTMTWYATRRNSNLVLITTTDHKKLILTPDEPAAFIETLRTFH